MTMDKEKFQELCSAYVLNALEGDERIEFENALKDADADMQYFEEMQWTALHLPMNAELVTPSADVKERILQTIAHKAAPRRESLFTKITTVLGFSRPQFAFALSLVLLLGVVGLMYYTFYLREVIYQRNQEIAGLRTEISTQQQRFVALQGELSKKEKILKVLQSPRIDVVIMNGLEVNPAGYGKIIWDPEKKTAILQISNLPPVPQDKDYQLWVIKDKKPISAGVFSLTDPVKEQFFMIEQLIESDKKAINAFAITLEPKGGVPQPTGKMYLIGSPS